MGSRVRKIVARWLVTSFDDITIPLQFNCPIETNT